MRRWPIISFSVVSVLIFAQSVLHPSPPTAWANWIALAVCCVSSGLMEDDRLEASHLCIVICCAAYICKYMFPAPAAGSRNKATRHDRRDAPKKRKTTSNNTFHTTARRSRSCLVASDIAQLGWTWLRHPVGTVRPCTLAFFLHENSGPHRYPA